MMKKIFCCILALGALQGVVFAQEARTLDEALQESAVYLKDRIENGSKVVVLNFQSDYVDLSNYIIDETIALLVNLGNLTVVDRQNLETIRQEMDFQMSGEVSDESAQSIGRKLGAQMIVSGSIAPLGDLYRFRIRAIEVETATIRGVNNQNIKLDEILALLTKNRSYRSPAAPRPDRNYDTGSFALDGKTRFGFSANAMYGTAWGFGGTVTVFEKFTPNFFVAPSVFITAKYFINEYDIKEDEYIHLFAGGVGILFKRRLTRNERLLLALGLSLEYIDGEAAEGYYYWSNDIGLFGMGIQGGLSYRLTPNISLDINGLVKLGFGSVDMEGGCDSNHLYTPGIGGVEIGVSFMF
jgi:TolB-like protein